MRGGGGADASVGRRPSEPDGQREALDRCVRCGFCLPVCPTYRRLGDEADSPRGRLDLMRAVVEGRLGAGSDAFRTHIDRCLGCRACEPVCPSGVPYGRLLERARAAAWDVEPPGAATRMLLRLFGSTRWTGWATRCARGLRSRGVGVLAGLLPPRGWTAAVRRALLMLAGSRPWRPDRFGAAAGGEVGGQVDLRPPETPRVEGSTPRGPGSPGGPPDGSMPGTAGTVAILTGCVQRGLFGRVREATAAVLRLNGYELLPADRQGCCGALHIHAGDREGARRLARINIAAFEASGADTVAVDAAGCGAALGEYGEWLADDPAWAERAAVLSGRVRDVTELLAARGPRRGAALVGSVAYDPPCHLEHAREVRDPPEVVLRAIPGLEVVRAEQASECCGGAGIHGLTHPDAGARIGNDKARALAATGASCVATGNPGCMMQIAAALYDLGIDVDVAHPVEILHESYRRAGWTS